MNQVLARQTGNVRARAGFAQKVESRWKSFLCGPLRISAFSALMGLSTQRVAEIRRGRRENKSDLPLLCKAARASNHLPLDQSSTTTCLSQCPSQILARFSASDDEDFVVLDLSHVLPPCRFRVSPSKPVCHPRGEKSRVFAGRRGWYLGSGLLLLLALASRPQPSSTARICSPRDGAKNLPRFSFRGDSLASCIAAIPTQIVLLTKTFLNRFVHQ